QMARASAHALHMPSHIFVQLGMWPQVEASNLAAVKASTDWAAAHDLPRARADWHSYAWLGEARVELGRAGELLPMIARVRELREEEDPGNWTLRHGHASLVSAWLAGTQQWARTEELLSTTDSRLEVRILLDAKAAMGDEGKAAQLAEQFAKLDSSPMAKLLVAARLAQAHSVRDSGSIG